MSSYRFYRRLEPEERMTAFTVKVKETDLWVAVDTQNYTSELPGMLEEYIWQKRQELEHFIQENPLFRDTLQPFILDNPADLHCVPRPALEMIWAGNQAGVGPMAAVAGLFAELAGKFLLEKTHEVMVENGGDIFLKVEEPCYVGIYAGDSPLNGQVALEISPQETPQGICTSSGKIGPSYSEGQADAVVVTSQSAPLADAAATALGNMVTAESHLESTLDAAFQIEGVRGVLIIYNDKMAARGNLKLTHP